jgi:hypothetical protein
MSQFKLAWFQTSRKARFWLTPAVMEAFKRLYARVSRTIMKFFHKIHVYKLLIKASLRRAIFNAFYSAIIVFLGSLAAQLQNTQQITTITIVTAILTATVTFLTELVRIIRFSNC